MRLEDIMSRPLLSVDVETSTREAWALMRSKGVRHLGVRDEGKVTGIVSHHDLRRDLRGTSTVREVMTTPVVTATPRTTLREAANLLRGRAIGCLPVVEGKRTVGIVTVTDILELIGRGVERPVAASRRWTLKRRGPRRRAIE